MRGQIRIRSAPYHYVYSSQKLKSKILHIHLLLICRRCFCAGEELSLVLWPCRCWPPWPTGSPLRTLENWAWSCFWCLWLKSKFLGTFHQDRLNKGSDQNLICPLKSKLLIQIAFNCLCRRNYLSGQSCLPCLWEHCREANDGFSCNCIVCICTGERLPNGKFLLYGGAVDIWLIWRGEQFLKLLLDPYFGCRGSLFHLKLGPYF